MRTYNRRSVSEKLSKYDSFTPDNEDFIEVTEWTNGEGWDITLGGKIISLSHSQLEAINHLRLSLDYIGNGEDNQ
nr:MAG TPA: hypothetical protein [Caudoviricetes sp.]